MEEEASREEGTDFSKGRNDKQKTPKRRPHFISSVQMWLKCQKCEAAAMSEAHREVYNNGECVRENLSVVIYLACFT